jgi:phosphomannomutase/phosphoglucomutase
MVRLFSLLSAFAVLMVLTAGVGVYWISAAQIAQAKRDSAAAVAKSVAVGISAQVNLLTNMLEKMALDPVVSAAVIRADTTELTTVAATLEKHLPDVLKVRLLLPGVSELDDKSAPKMGYADLDMVRETLTKNQLPAIQGDNGPDRHLAITRRIMHNNQVAGVILASLNYDFIDKTVQAAELKGGYLELRQAELVLVAAGEPASMALSDDAQIKVANTGWELHYQVADSASSTGLTFIVGMIAVPALLALLAFFMGYRKLSAQLTQDLGSVLKAYKDMMKNKLQGTYPVNLAEMNAVVSTLVQFKRVMDNQDIDVVGGNNAIDLEMSRFFDESEDLVTAGARTKGVNFNKPATEKIQPAKLEIADHTVPDSFDMPQSVNKK